MRKKTIRKYSAKMVEVHAAGLREIIARLDHVLSLGLPLPIQAMQEERAFFAEMLAFAESRSDATQ